MLYYVPQIILFQIFFMAPIEENVMITMLLMGKLRLT